MVYNSLHTTYFSWLRLLIKATLIFWHLLCKGLSSHLLHVPFTHTFKKISRRFADSRKELDSKQHSFALSISHWPILGWNVSKSCFQKVDFFENYAIVAKQSEIVTFCACKIIKETSGFNLKNTIFFARRRHHLKNTWNIFQIQITPLLWRPQGPQGCLEKQNFPLSSNLVVWCTKIWPKTQKLPKIVEKL